MNTIEMKMSIGIIPDSSEDCGFRYKCVESHETWLLPDTAAVIGETTISILVPPMNEIELRMKVIEHLEDKIKKERIDFYQREEELRQKINALLLLEHKPAEEVSDIIIDGEEVCDATINHENLNEEI